jgi:L-asparaginase II
MSDLSVTPAAAAKSAGGARTPAPLAVVMRGDAVDSVHLGSVAVVDRDGRLLCSAGDPGFLTMTRSALKPFQAMPFAAADGIKRFDFSPAQVALLCASHSGEPRHVAAAASMLAKAGNGVEDLKCGTHPPRYHESRGEPTPPPPYSPLENNCSGKHSGMLAYCVLCGLPKASYLAYDHPLQQAIRGAVAHFTSTPEGQLRSGIDGCSAPNYAVPLERLALAFARLAARHDDAVYGRAPQILADAMTAHPEMVSGEGRSDLELMRAGGGDWVAKIGAEGVQGIGVRGAGIGIAIKVADGNKRALRPVVVSVLEQLGLLDEERRSDLAQWVAPVVHNYRGLVTGRILSKVVLDNIGTSAGGSRCSSNTPTLR